MSLVVRGGTVVTPRSVAARDLLVEDGRITAVAAPGTAKGNIALDAGGLLVLPGMVDAHVHFDEPGRTDWEGFDSGSAAAVAGGVTTVVDMPIDCDPPTVTADAVRAKVAAARLHSRTDVALWGGLVPGSVDDLEPMAKEGVIGFKAFACPSGWDDFPRSDEDTLTAGATIAARLRLPVAVHCELEELGHTIESEVAALRMAAQVASAVGARLHAVHLSSAEAVDEARRWPTVTTETCAHYLVLDAASGPYGHCFPPVRDTASRAALWERVVAGGVDLIASDHSPCPPALKVADPPWAGIDEVGMTLPLLLSSGRLSLSEVAALTTAAARLLRLPGKGAIAEGCDADLVLVDPDARWTPERESLRTRHRCSPYVGRPLTGRVVTTLVRGTVMFSNDAGPEDPGRALVLRPT